MSQVPFGKSRISGFAHSATLTTTDIEIRVYKNGGTVVDENLTNLAQGSVRLDENSDQVATYQYGTDTLAEGDSLRELITSVGANFDPITKDVLITAAISNTQLIPVTSSCCNCQPQGYVVSK